MADVAQLTHALAARNRGERAAHPEGEQQIYPRWQQSQYVYSMFSVRHETLDNAHYPDLRWAKLADVRKTQANK